MPSARHRLIALLLCASAGVSPLRAQTHKVEKQEKVVRAIGVYEYTGDLLKPDASRLIPVSIFIDGQMQDAAIYLERPVPLSLQVGNLYSLETAGNQLALFDVLYARHLTSDLVAFDDGWFGYGEVTPPVAPKVARLKPAATNPVLSRSGQDVAAEDEDDDTPHLVRRAGSEASDAPPAPAPPASAGTAPATTTASNAPVNTSGNRQPGNDPDDPERPTLRRRSPQEQKDAQKKSTRELASVRENGSLNDDPNRPTLHRGRPAGAISGEDLAKLSGLPQDMHQLTAVSDASETTRPVHSFARPFEYATERASVLAAMQAFAAQQVAAYNKLHAAAPAASAAPVRSTAAGRTSASRATPKAKPAPPVDAPRLQNEQLTAYTLSYGGAATFIYTAEAPAPATSSSDGATRYVTIVAQADLTGAPQLAMHSVTDAKHLDRTPWMRPIDAVDPDDSNRASLLFELRAQHSRQFALYRVIAAKADQIFVTASTQ